ncbi:unnamed protein product [Lactuca saligna]|uniref:Histone-lysine N-methyltransferase n=1 Tax=Lactuca saligna TaxID=75948 RepID=A0AA35VWL3_LACSI|nr:unnamed protein product [Lactuca saligna]
MAFHVACPITCRRICYCSLGFPREVQNEKGQIGFLEEIDRLKAFLDDPWLIKDDKKRVQVLVPKVDVTPPPPQLTVTPNAVVVDGGCEDAADEMLSAQNKRAAMQKKAAAASLVAEDYARRFESGDPEGVNKDLAGEEQVISNGKVMCRLCFSGENERSVRAKKMLSCKTCNKKYHRSCLKTWAHDRDLFHWTSWTCPSCRICEVCRRTGDPNKLMFCKRCDAAYHCYCQHPPHKNVSKGPYLCPKHTKCHSCASTVPGNGSSLRWFLGYTCCDACGRLFVKGNYCPVCLKVYRDSESTPMVCCDVCQRWVHCHCDGISDERYLQFQVDNHLQYSCATCRGECYQVRDLEDAVQELWRRRDKAEHDLITSLRAAAGLPTQEEIFAISPYSDEDDDTPPPPPPPPLKKEYGHSLKFSLKGLIENKSPNKKNKKKSSKRYGKEKGHSDAQSIGSITGDNNNNKDEDVESFRSSESDFYKNKNKLVNEISGTSFKFFKGRMKEESGKDVKSKDIKGRKLVIHLGGRHKTSINSPRSDVSNSLVDQPLTTPNRGEDMVQERPKDNYLDMLANANSSKLSDVEGDNLNHDDDETGVSFGKRSTNRSVTPGSGSEKVTPSLRLKFKNPYSDDQSFVKGQRSKRKRPLTFMDKSSSFVQEEDNNNKNKNKNKKKGDGNSYDEIMDAKWIIQKLGKHAIGKIVEVHHPSNNSWHKGTIIEFCEDTSTVLVTLDDGKAMNVDLGKQGIRFVSKKQRL